MAQTGEWVVLNLDEKLSRRHGMPMQMPMPKEKFEELGLEGLTHEVAQEYVRQFLAASGHQLRKAQPEVAKRYEAYLAKMPFWKDAQKAFESGDVAKAIKQLSMVCSVDKQDYAARQNLATAYAAAGRSEDALKVFREIAEVWTGAADYHVAFANVLLLSGDREAALEQFVSALEADPQCHPAMEGLVSLGVLVKIYEDPLDASSLVFVKKDSVLEYLAGQWSQTDPTAEHLLRVAAYHEEERRFDVMLGAAERALDKEPERPEAVLARARALRHLERREEARSFVAEQLERSPESATLLVELAQCERDLGNVEAARGRVQRALELEPGNLLALQLEFLPPANEQLEAVQQALPLVRAFAEGHPEAHGAWRLLGRLSARAGDGDASDAAFARALELAPDDQDSRAEYWNTLMQRSEFQKILEQAASIADLAQKDWRLRWCEADAYHSLGKKMEARAAFTAINADKSLHVAIRARAKRAVEQMSGG